MMIMISQQFFFVSNFILDVFLLKKGRNRFWYFILFYFEFLVSVEFVSAISS
jgi:hypothetical protein